MDNDKFNQAVGNYLHNRRKALGLTYKQVGEKMGKSKDWYREIERGRNSVKFNDMILICEALGIDMGEIKKYAMEQSRGD